MRRALTALCLVAVVSAPLRAELKYTLRMDMKKSDAPAAAPANPMLAMMGETMMKQLLPGGSGEMIYMVGEQGARIEFTQAAMGQAAGAITLSRPDGTTFVLNPAAKTYWKTTAQAAADAMKAAGVTPEVTAKRTGQSETVAGVKCDVVSFDWKMALPIPEAARASLPPGFPSSLEMSGDSCTTDQYPKYAEIIAKSASGMMASMGLDKVSQGGIILRQTMQLMGYEMKSVVTEISEGPVAPALFELPADYKEVPMPSGMPK